LLTRNKSFHIILLLLLFSSIISSETRILEISNIRINPGENKIPTDGGSFLTWNNNNVSVNGVNIFESGNENIVNVIINSQKTKPEAVIITENSQNTLNYSFQLLKDDQISFIHSLEKEYDGALPKLLFTKNNLLMLLPETQHVTIFDSNGSLSGEFDLFEEISWSHEKKILTASDKNDYLFLLGMESANLTKNHNVSLFSLIENPEFIINLPLSMPYFFSISSKNIYAIIGTNSKSSSITQTPVLILLDQNYKLLNQTVELKKLPKNISWYKDELILIYKDHLMIYSTDNQTFKHEIKFEQKIFPLDIITYNESIFVISALEIGVGKNGNYYQSMVLLEYDTDFNTIAFHPLLHGSFNRVKYFPNQGNTFYLQLDNHFIQYEISK
jgi:hypothetical protein